MGGGRGGTGAMGVMGLCGADCEEVDGFWVAGSLTTEASFFKRAGASTGVGSAFVDLDAVGGGTGDDVEVKFIGCGGGGLESRFG